VEFRTKKGPKNRGKEGEYIKKSKKKRISNFRLSHRKRGNEMLLTGSGLNGGDVRKNNDLCVYRVLGRDGRCSIEHRLGIADGDWDLGYCANLKAKV
jgi:hypothetical protein